MCVDELVPTLCCCCCCARLSVAVLFVMVREGFIDFGVCLCSVCPFGSVVHIGKESTRVSV